MTHAQKKVLDAISAFVTVHGYSPTMQQIAEISGHRAKSSVHKHVQNLISPKRFGPHSVCVCECGKVKTVKNYYLYAGSIRSCGCLNKDRPIRHGAAAGGYKHGDTAGGKFAPEYNTWVSMLHRCGYSTHECFARYGGRGITVCPEWKDYVVFLRDVGRKPSPRHTLDRIKSDGNYEPGNVRWATRKEQNRNRSTNRRVTALGKTLCLAEWSDRVGNLISGDIISARLSAGWGVEDAITTPKGCKPGKSKQLAVNLA